jgi:hypothetical protein
LTLNSRYVHLNNMRAARLQNALERLTAAIRDVESELAAMKAEHDPLASHIFLSRRSYRNVKDTKSGKAPRDDGPAEFQYCLRNPFRDEAVGITCPRNVYVKSNAAAQR